MSTLKVNTIQDASGGSNAVLYGPASPAGSMGFRNRIINGAMIVNQRNTTITDYGYATDRWSYNPAAASKASVAQSTTAPTGFINSLLVTSTAATTPGSTDVYIVEQKIEGLNIADLGFGTASAKTITLSFWVRSSLTGTFSGALGNAGPDRSYPFTYTINSANTFEYKTVTITGDTTGTWATNNGTGFRVCFSLGCGSSRSGTAGSWTGTSNIFAATGETQLVATNGATFYITGVQLEVGSVATEFERRPYGTELVLCQRYYEKSYAAGIVPGTGGVPPGFMSTMNNGTITGQTPGVYFKVTKRTAPTATFYNGVNGTSGQAYRESDAAAITVSASYISESGVPRLILGSSKEDQYVWHFTADAEL